MQPQASAPFHIHRFWTEYKPDPNRPGALREVDMVAYGPIGARDRTVTIERVSRLALVDTKTDPSVNPAVAMARGRWEFIKPRYDAWKDGQEVPQNGSPLSMWTQLGREQVETLQSHGVKTIEDLAALTDGHIQRIQITGLRSLIEGAKRFLAAADSNRLTAEMTARDETIANQKSEIDDLRQKLDELAGLVAQQVDRPARTESEQQAINDRMAKARAAKGKAAA